MSNDINPMDYAVVGKEWLEQMDILENQEFTANGQPRTGIILQLKDCAQQPIYYVWDDNGTWNWALKDGTATADTYPVQKGTAPDEDVATVVCMGLLMVVKYAEQYKGKAKG